MRRTWRVGALAAAVGWYGCVDALDASSDVRDLRVLAVRAEPPEVMYDLRLDPGTGLPVLDPTGLPILEPSAGVVVFDALVVDPRGSVVEYRWEVCPVQSTIACRDYEEQRAQAPEPLRDALDQMREIEQDGAADPVDDPAHAVAPYAVAPFSFAPPPTLLAYHLSQTGAGAGFGAWPSALLRVSGGGDSIDAAKRFVVSLAPRAVGSLGDLAERFGGADEVSEFIGLRLCGPGQEPPPGETCLRLAPRGPNANPVFGPLQVSFGRSADADWQPLAAGEIVRLRAGESMRILPAFTGASLEPYQHLQADLDTREIRLVDAVEDPSVSWFASAGELQDTMTWPLFTKTLDTLYTAPVHPEEDGERVTVWLVGHDGRGGVAWTTVELEVVLPGVPVDR